MAERGFAPRGLAPESQHQGCLGLWTAPGALATTGAVFHVPGARQALSRAHRPEDAGPLTALCSEQALDVREPAVHRWTAPSSFSPFALILLNAHLFLSGPWQHSPGLRAQLELWCPWDSCAGRWPELEMVCVTERGLRSFWVSSLASASPEPAGRLDVELPAWAAGEPCFIYLRLSSLRSTSSTSSSTSTSTPGGGRSLCRGSCGNWPLGNSGSLPGTPPPQGQRQGPAPDLALLMSVV